MFGLRRISAPCICCVKALSYSHTNSCRNEYHQKVIAKGVHHFRLQNERDVLLRFQHRTQSIRPLIEELEDSDTPPTLILKYLDDDVLNASDKQRLTAPEVKFVAKKVLGALAVLHDEGFIHTGGTSLPLFPSAKTILI